MENNEKKTYLEQSFKSQAFVQAHAQHCVKVSDRNDASTMMVPDFDVTFRVDGALEEIHSRGQAFDTFEFTRKGFCPAHLVLLISFSYKINKTVCFKEIIKNCASLLDDDLKKGEVTRQSR